MAVKKGKMLDLTGDRYGNLIVVKLNSKRGGEFYWDCQCDCGNTKIVSTKNLRREHTKSCGCILWKHAPKTHNLSKTRLYKLWIGMKSRCYNPKNKAYHNYGGRGITVCDEWLHDFMAFHDWALNNGYSDKLTIDKIDNNKGYSPDNCRWVTMKEQESNKRTNRFYEYQGEVKTLAQWADEYNINRSTFRYRLERGWSIEKTIETPVIN